MRKTFVVVSGVVALACGGGGGGSGAPAGPTFRDPDQARFTYSAPAPATYDEGNAASSAEANLAEALAVASTTDPSTAGSAALSLALATTSVGDVFPGGVPSSANLVADSGARLASARRLLASRAAAVDTGPAWNNPACLGGDGAGTVTFDHCTMSDSGAGYTETLRVNGSVELGVGHLAYDLTWALTDSEATDSGTFDMSISERLRAELAYTATTFDGFTRTDLWLSMSQGGQSAAFGVTFNADYDLGYLDDPGFCITDGSMTLKRLWIEHPQGTGIDPTDYTDAAVRFTWEPGASAAECSTGVSVAWGTPQ